MLKKNRKEKQRRNQQLRPIRKFRSWELNRIRVALSPGKNLDFNDADEEAAWAENIASITDHTYKKEAPFSIIYISNSRLEATVPKVKGHQKVLRRVNAQN